ncbi:MAG: hypothetical protein IJQ29_09295 [Synergistaceae bacterium]|nr:hypothetical protein [Synergistaceae bacterium]
MRYYLEYNVETTRVSSIISVQDDVLPTVQDGYELLEVSENEALNLNTSLIGVLDGKIINLYETPAEKRERERIQREKRVEAELRLREIRSEFITAGLEDDSEKLARLKSEYRALLKII